MSESEAKRTDVAEREAFARLEAAVGRLVDRASEMGMRARKAEARIRELEALLKRYANGRVDPGALQAQISRLEEENAEMGQRLADGRDGVDRLLSRLRFLEDQRP